MNNIVKEDIITILSQIMKILEIKEEKDVGEIKELSNHTIHNSSIFQDEDSISIAVLVYSLSKIIERGYLTLNYTNIRKFVAKALASLRKEEIGSYRDNIKRLFDFIRNTDSKFRFYIQEVISQSEIKKAGKIYAHGISIGRAAEIMGISQWDLLRYIGQTTLPEIEEEIINVRQRLKFTRGLFS